MTVILLSSEENEFSLLCFHILIYCLTTGKSGAENSALLVETCEQSPCRKQPKRGQLVQQISIFLDTVQARELLRLLHQQAVHGQSTSPLMRSV